MANYRTTGEIGENCPRCKKPTQVREHKSLKPKHFKQPYYFSRWFFCPNPNCPVTIHMSEQYKVYNNNKAARQFKMFEEDRENMETIRKLL